MVPEKWGIAIKMLENVEVTLELGFGQRPNSLEGSEGDRKMGESLEIPRDLLNGHDQYAGSDMNNKVRAEVVSDGAEELLGTGAKVTLVLC